jgi:hypothetical protein
MRPMIVVMRAEIFGALEPCPQAWAPRNYARPKQAHVRPWRHTFKAGGFRYGVSEKVLDAIARSIDPRCADRPAPILSQTFDKAHHAR